MNTQQPSVVTEEYLQLIYQFHCKGETLKAVALVHATQNAPPTVHSHLQRMQRDNLITLGKKKEIQLTNEGKQKAEDIVFRHQLAECFLYSTLKIPWYEIHKHAHQLEHALTPLVAKKLAAFLGFPESCPHGSPMPGTSAIELAESLPLDQVETGVLVKVMKIDEFLEDSEELLKHLYEHHIVPGHQHQIIERVAGMGTLTLKSKESQITLPLDICKKIKVALLPS